MLATQVTYNSTVFEAHNGYCTYSNTTSNDGCKKPRRQRYKATPQAMAKVNAKNSLMLCQDIVNANFEPTDIHITITFPPQMPDDVRQKLLIKAGRRLRSLHERKKQKIVYIYSWGRGGSKKLHTHLGVKRYDNISEWEIENALTNNGKDPLTVHIEKMYREKAYNHEQRTIYLNIFAAYLWKSYNELTVEDKKKIKCHWYGSKGLQHTMPANYTPDRYTDTDSLGDVTITRSDEHDRHISGNPRKQNSALVKIIRCGMLNDKTFNRIIGFRRQRYHIVEGSVRLIDDGFGHTNIYMQLIKLGSEIDIKYNPQRAKHKKFIHIYKRDFFAGIDFGRFRCNWEAIPI